ncbi:D-xylose transporter [Pontibacillus halophilus JSM 076056 = DSM 19796]|uniref:D-xylose transporter n=1 Tax=Pontibacillus halophilus JSM 076056 = DSM 19796 TaxID=1385510 RepID=A0A0A5IBJ6_9BACI|nr:sugar porter family MFS transporter [Pontibacillus halophilus]KGX93212.1 D-xylose transporter [Pontibacillus halophilus JSM 076056 = DSM 19796]
MNHPKAYATMIAIVAAIGGILYGYDTAVINGSVGFVESYFNLGASAVGWAVSSALVGSLIGASTAGKLADRLGRKKTLLIAATLFGLSAIFSAIPPNFTVFFMARIVGGIGMGIASIVTPMYISEIAPNSMRGLLGSFYQVAVTFGILTIYFVNYEIVSVGSEAWNVNNGWRYMFASELIPALLFFLLLWGIPESPRWLAMQNNREKTLSVLQRFFHKKEDAEHQLRDIEKGLEEEEGKSGQGILSKKWRLPLFVGIGLAFLQQVSGINVIMYYATEFLGDFNIGTGENSSYLQSVYIGLVNFLATFIATATLDKFGRKTLLIIGSTGMALSMTIVGIMIYMQAVTYTLMVFIFLYIICFAFSWGPIAWVLLSEIFPNRIRGKVMSISVFVLWSSNILVSQTFPMMNQNGFLQSTFNGAFPFLVYGVFCLLCIPFSIKFVPETKGRSLEDIERMWNERTGYESEQDIKA